MADVRALSCPNCGGTVQLRGYAQTLNAVCEHCLAILDARTPELRVLQTVQQRERIQPLIPLGTRGKLRGELVEAIGFQERTIWVEGVAYSWREYLLFNPYKGYRYLTEYDGHWNLVRTIDALPQPGMHMSRNAVRLGGKTFAHFQSAQAKTTYVLGEFPWQVRVGDTVAVDDYVSAPEMVSSETTPEETVWSRGAYITGGEVWQSFGLKGTPPEARGVYADQPSPYGGKLLAIWSRFFLLCVALAVVAAILAVIGHGRALLEQTYRCGPGGVCPPYVTPVFDVQEAGGVNVRVRTDAPGDGTGFAISLINDDTGQAWDTGGEVDERAMSVSMSHVPPGRYYLRVEPQADNATEYSLAVTYSRVAYWPLVFALILIAIPPVFSTIRYFQFEGARWRESDYGSMPGTSNSSSDDD